MPETQDDGSEKFARVGSVSKSHDAQWGPAFRFLPNPNVDPIPASTIQNLVTNLEISSEGWGGGEFSRTHWAVKDVDLFQVLFEHQTRLSKVARRPSARQVPFGSLWKHFAIPSWWQ